ncbi:hypothetical protein EJ03DRAFT_85309 [Teratosphaeria nubilosa]|uniref:Zn(2)-C6 fungal-type domain-containing protein n=1 Tax=Teratosphaeria nubilosa TaxID=161662 RepID=A0A6G1LA99_9PEZI|nr:hypothetical protein EJ03DRAFT_85309 [Teratosphaeria nubilosa]
MFLRASAGGEMDSGSPMDGTDVEEASRPLQVKRTTLTKNACLGCRKSKSKCDGRRPTCQRCHGRSAHCVYDLQDGMTRQQDYQRRLDKSRAENDDLALFVRTQGDENDRLNVVVRNHVDENDGLNLLSLSSPAIRKTTQTMQEPIKHTTMMLKHTLQSQCLATTSTSLYLRSASAASSHKEICRGIATWQATLSTRNPCRHLRHDTQDFAGKNQ